jgi:hypothetical protein
MRSASTLRRWKTRSFLVYWGAPLVALVMVLLAPLPVLADAPGTRGPKIHGQGSVGAPPSGAGAGATDAVWRDVRELPPPSMATRGPGYAPFRQQSGGESSAITWLGRSLNPGNWILDAGMGIFAGIVKMFGGIMQKAVESFLGTASVLPAGCDNAATNFVFCTPASLTYDHPGVKIVWGVLSGIASSLVTILFTVRLGRMIVEGPRTLASEGKGLLLTFIFAMTFIQATYSINWLIIEFFNGISNLLLSRAALSLPSQDVGDLNIGSNILFLILWILILLLIIKSFARIVQIIILIACAPIAGALLMDRSTSSRFRSWFEKLIELLLGQINLAIIFIVITAILQPYAGRGAGDAFVSFLLSIVMMGMALSGKSVIGVAGAAMSGGGNGLLSFLKYQVVGGALRKAMRGGGRTGDGYTATSTTDPHLRAGVGAAQRAAPESRERNTRASGDPSQSAAAQRQTDGTSSSSTTPSAPAPVGSFRLGDASAGLASQRASARYQAAGQTVRTADGQLAGDARRKQALMRATMMRHRATTLRETGDRTGAEELARKARLQERFGRGQDITQPSRFTASSRATRRQTYRKALGEVVGMHALERDALTQQIGADEARLPTVQRDLALTGSTGGDTTALHEEQRTIEQRLAIGRARAQAIAPREDGSPAPATRTAAAALANERLEPTLRSSAYAARLSAGSGSAFARRVTGGPTEGARNELAQTRAHAVRVAQTPRDLRAPVAPVRPARPRSMAGKRYEEGAPRPQAGRATSNGQGNAPAMGAPARPSRARSSTIEHLRAQQIRAAQQGNSSGGDPIPHDTPRPAKRGDDADAGASSLARAQRFTPRRRPRPEPPEE